MIGTLPTGAFSCFVTGTDTEIGKTLVSAALLHILAKRGVRVAAMKPIAAGAQWRDGAWHNDDTDMLAAEVNVPMLQALTTPYMLQTPAAPHIAAAIDKVTIDPSHIQACFHEVKSKAQAVVVEGVGGFRVPLTDSYDTSDMAQQLGLPVILVVGLRLGCISQALLTVEAIQARGLTLVGWVANMVDPDMGYVDANIQALAKRINAPMLGNIPRLTTPSAAQAASFIYD